MATMAWPEVGGGGSGVGRGRGNGACIILLRLIDGQKCGWWR